MATGDERRDFGVKRTRSVGSMSSVNLFCFRSYKAGGNSH